MAEKIANFSGGKRSKKEDESVLEYYLDLRKSALEAETKNSQSTAWRSLYRFITYYNESHENDIEFSDMSEELVREYIEWLRGRDTIRYESTVYQYVSQLSQSVSWFNKNGIIVGNPFAMVLNSEFEQINPLPKISVPITELRSGIANISDPQTLYVVIGLLKTGMRLSEFVNLDERDVNIDHPISSTIEDTRPELTGKPDALYVDSSISRGMEYNGEVRTNSNKKSSTRIIPLDTEFKEVMAWYLAMRPIPDSNAKPILVANGAGNGTTIGERLSGVSVRANIFNPWADNHGWYSSKPNSVKPHWCRHWFTTQIRTNVDNGDVEIGTKDDFEDFLRGDTSSSSKDDYIQMNWGKEQWVGDTLEDALPQLLIGSCD